MNHSEKALNSYQVLRGKAHQLLEEKFPDRRIRYAWLTRNFPKVHMSQMNKEELHAVIAKIQTA